MPDDHYHPINDNTYTLQHYLNNTNKYFTSNTQLHFLPGQYYLNTDLIIQGVSNFSLIGNRINEIINTVINCNASPAGIVLVDSSNITVANIVMNECVNNYTTHLNGCLFNRTKVCLSSLIFLQCKLITCSYFYSNNGIEFKNPLVNTKLFNLTTKYVAIWYNKYVENANHTFYMNNIPFHNHNIDVYAVQIKQINMASNILVTIQHVKFTNPLASYIICVNCTGHSSTTVGDCNFTNNPKISLYYYGGDYAYHFKQIINLKN